MKTIRVDAEVYNALQKLAIPLIDNPNKVLRKLLKLEVVYSKNLVGGKHDIPGSNE